MKIATVNCRFFHTWSEKV